MNRPPLNQREIKVALALIDSGGLNSYGIAHHCMMSHRSARRMIEKLLIEGVIERRGSSSRSRYILTGHGKYVLEESMKENV